MVSFRAGLPVFARTVRGTVALLFGILALDVLILVFAVYTLLVGIERRVLLRMEVIPVPLTARCPAPAPLRLAALLGMTAASRDISGEITNFGYYGGACTPRNLDGQMRLSYDVSARASSAGYRSSLDGINLTGYRALEFSVKGETGDEVFSVCIDDGRESDQVPISRFLPQELPRQWQKVSLPLGEFPRIRNWHRMQGRLTIAFDHGLGMPYRGTIYVKDVQFVR